MIKIIIDAKVSQILRDYLFREELKSRVFRGALFLSRQQNPSGRDLAFFNFPQFQVT